MALIDVIDRDAVLPRHGHAAPYAAVVLTGGYEEAGEGGRFRAEPGDVLIHAPFSAHLDRAAGRRTTVMNLPLPWLQAGESRRMRLDDPDEAIRLARSDGRTAAQWLLAAARPGDARLDDAPDRLAATLSVEDPVSLTVWSDAHGVTRETAWRWFTAAYGVGPAGYRVEARARRAWRRLTGGDEPLVGIALSEGFADQAHMSRDVRALTGRPPGAWRAMQQSFKTTGT